MGCVSVCLLSVAGALNEKSGVESVQSMWEMNVQSAVIGICREIESQGLG
jgi:hypothetical protein